MQPMKPIMTDDEYRLGWAIVEATRAGDFKKMLALVQSKPLHPTLGLNLVKTHGKQYLLDSGWDLSECDKVHGQGWMDKFDNAYGTRKIFEDYCPGGQKTGEVHND